MFREVSGGFAHRLTPYVVCSYDVDCEDIADLRTDTERNKLGVASDDLACAWGDALIARREPESWGVVRRLTVDGFAGILVPSFANGATAADQNLVLWQWGRNCGTRLRCMIQRESCRRISCRGAEAWREGSK